MRITTVFGGIDRHFNVRVLFPGERYGYNHCVIHNGKEPLVEFWDAAQDTAKFGPLGQFVTRYNLSTMFQVENGLMLDGGVFPWQITAAAWPAVRKFLEELR